jgi:hypothetical protein
MLLFGEGEKGGEVEKIYPFLIFSHPGHPRGVKDLSRVFPPPTGQFRSQLHIIFWRIRLIAKADSPPVAVIACKRLYIELR